MTRVVILGGGFAAVYAALRLDRTIARRPDVEVTLVSRDNFLLFTPMLHEVAAGDLSPGDIVSPIRRMLRRVRFVQGNVEAIDVERRRVRGTRDVRRLPLVVDYDHLLVALGSETNFFGMQDVAENAVTLKTLGDAALLRARILESLEMASIETDQLARRTLLTFAVAGGGFAGVETVGAINDLVRDAIRYYPGIARDDVRVVQVFPQPLVLPELGERLGRYALEKLVSSGVEMRPSSRVTGFRDARISLSSGESLPAGTLVWTAGTTPNPILESLPCRKTNGRVAVDEFLQVEGLSGVWAAGDCAAVIDIKTGKPQPPTAQHALRQGYAAARNIEAAVAGRTPAPFRFSTIGQLASIGHRRGVATILGVRFSGFAAWMLWRTVYLLKLPRVAKKVRVALSWTLEMLFSRDLEQTVTVRDVELISRIAARLRSA